MVKGRQNLSRRKNTTLASVTFRAVTRKQQVLPELDRPQLRSLLILVQATPHNILDENVLGKQSPHAAAIDLSFMMYHSSVPPDVSYCFTCSATVTCILGLQCRSTECFWLGSTPQAVSRNVA